MEWVSKIKFTKRQDSKSSLNGREPHDGSEFKHNSATWAVGHTSLICYRYVPGHETGAKFTINN